VGVGGKNKDEGQSTTLTSRWNNGWTKKVRNEKKGEGTEKGYFPQRSGDTAGTFRGVKKKMCQDPETVANQVLLGGEKKGQNG